MRREFVPVGIEKNLSMSMENRMKRVTQKRQT
jgi:hypothetical protein